jgi:hypothetical protein
VGSYLIEASEKALCSLSLRERVGVRDSRSRAIAGVSLLLASSLREEEQAQSRFAGFFRGFYSWKKMS